MNTILTTDELRARIESAIQSLPLPSAPAHLYEPVRYALSCGGKRLRPTLLLAAVQALGGDVDKAMPQALGIEMYHNFTLLHDDVMDNADMRRGRQTVHRKWDTNTAILCGDVMLSLALRLMYRCPADHMPSVVKIFNDTAIEVDEGQQYDMDFETRDDVTVPEYIEMIRLKTSVLLGCALSIGACLADAGEAVREALYEYGESLGLAFQLQDDYLDTFGDPAVFGKQVGGDILNAKKTWLWISAMREDTSGEMSRAAAGQWHGEEKISRVSDIYRRLGLDRRIVDLIGIYTAQAKRCLERTGLPADRLTVLGSLADSLATRGK